MPEGFRVELQPGRAVVGRRSEDVAREIQRRCNLQLSDVPSYLQEFVDRYSPQDLHHLSLRLV